MYDDQTKDVRFIDYEYAQLGPAGLDVANHFNAVRFSVDGAFLDLVLNFSVNIGKDDALFDAIRISE